MSKVTHFAGAVAAVTLTSVTSVNAHTPQNVAHILRDHGYTKIEFVETNPPTYMANACKNGVRYHFHVNFYGVVTQRREIGYCGRGYDDNRRSQWRRNYDQY